MAPTFANGKICYVEMPATDVTTSAEFYKTVFGWAYGNEVTEGPPLTTRSAG
jgi:predicted enzyme related to lactoylglutathione lyase